MPSPPVVRHQSYGKSQVRLSRIERHDQRHEFIDLIVSIALDGDFSASYSAADNSKVIATDTMKNTVYVLARQRGVKSIEYFAQLLAKHFLDTYSQVERVDLDCEEKLWTRMLFDTIPHNHAFIGGSGERNTCNLVGLRDGDVVSQMMHSGLDGLQVLKTTGSGFSGFFRDEYTTLSETEDRIFASTIQAGWYCRDLTADWTASRQTIRAALLDVFANQYSSSVQNTIYEMGRAALTACPLIEEISITMPNQHHLLVNLALFELQNPDEVFVPTDEPFGKIYATITRTETKETT